MVQRGQVQLQHRPRQARQPQQGSSSNSDVHQQARQPRAATEECWNSGALRLKNNRSSSSSSSRSSQRQQRGGEGTSTDIRNVSSRCNSNNSGCVGIGRVLRDRSSPPRSETPLCSMSRCGRQGDIAAGGYKTNDLSSSSSSSTCDCIGICSSGSCNNRCHLGCVVGGEASCEAGTYRREWRPIRRSSNTSCIVGSGDSSFDPGVHCLERRRRCVASADAGGGDSAERGVAWTGSAATLAASGAAAAASHAE